VQKRHGDEEDEGEAHEGMAGMSEHNSTPSTAPVLSEHSHSHSHAAPLLELNETLILLTHSPDPMSYWEFDQSEEGKPAVLYIHIVLMSFAFFGLLPLCKLRPFPLSSLGGGNDEVGRRRREEGGKALTRFSFSVALFLKAGGSSLSVIPQVGFLATSIVGLIFGQVRSFLPFYPFPFLILVHFLADLQWPDSRSLCALLSHLLGMDHHDPLHRPQHPRRRPLPPPFHPFRTHP
jgi:hypothetical protein